MYTPCLSDLPKSASSRGSSHSRRITGGSAEVSRGHNKACSRLPLAELQLSAIAITSDFGFDRAKSTEFSEVSTGWREGVGDEQTPPKKKQKSSPEMCTLFLRGYRKKGAEKRPRRKDFFAPTPSVRQPFFETSDIPGERMVFGLGNRNSKS